MDIFYRHRHADMSNRRTATCKELSYKLIVVPQNEEIPRILETLQFNDSAFNILPLIFNVRKVSGVNKLMSQ
jgi:hypothetical protein